VSAGAEGLLTGFGAGLDVFFTALGAAAFTRVGALRAAAFAAGREADFMEVFFGLLLFAGAFLAGILSSFRLGPENGRGIILTYSPVYRPAKSARFQGNPTGGNGAHPDCRRSATTVV